jgi:predicted CXXCH cytochrome family protein
VAFSLENKACLECHGTRDILQAGKGERLQMVVPTPGKQEVRKGGLTLYVDDGQFHSTVHRELHCTDCHTDVKDIPHPQRVRVVNCAQCHQEIVGQYEKSLHATVSNRLCFECHNPHATTSFKKLSQQARMAICLQCHKEDGHQWLPQQQLHFKYLECTACHAPEAEKGIVFYLQRVTEEGKAEQLDYGAVATLLGGKRMNVVKLLDSDGNGFLEDQEVLSFLHVVKEKNPREDIELGVRVLVLKPSHNFTDKGTQAKECALCHSSQAKFYSKLIMEIPESGGGVRTLPMDKSILAGIHAIPVTRGFYLLGEGRLTKRDVADLLFMVRKIGYKWLDVIGILFIGGGVGFVCLHACIRIITIKIRKQRHY